MLLIVLAIVLGLEPPSGSSPSSPSLAQPAPPPGFAQPSGIVQGPASAANGPADIGEGLLIEDLVVGNGPAAALIDTVIANHTLRLKDGPEIENIAADTPFVKRVDRLFNGYARGIVGMRAGGTRRITIPHKFAFGDKGRRNIPPQTDLVIEIGVQKLMKVEDLSIGQGTEVGPGATVTIHIVSRIKETGRVIENTTSRATGMRIGLLESLDCYRVGLPGMKVGGKRKLTVPWELAYGEKGFPPLKVAPKTDITIEVDMLAVEPLMLPNGREAKTKPGIVDPPPKPATDPAPDK